MSPEVWGDARPRIEAAAAAQSLAVAWPNESFTAPQPPAPWLDIEFNSAADTPIEIGATTWQEDGALWLHIMLPTGSGLDTALALKDALSVAFRNVTDAVTGLVYRGGQSTDPITDGTDDGVYVRLTLAVRYIFQSRVA